MPLLQVLALLLLLGLTWLAWYQRKMARYTIRYPGPLGLPYLGNFAVLDPAVLIEKFKALKLQYGNVFELWFLGSRMVVVTNPKIAREVFCMRPKTFMRLRNNLTAFADLGVESNVFAAEGKEWGRFRRLTAPAFNKSVLGEMTADIIEEADVFCERLKSMADGRTVINAGEEMMRFTVATIMRVGLGRLDGVQAEAGDYCRSAQLVHDTSAVFTYLISRVFYVFPEWSIPFSGQLKSELAIAKQGVDRMRMLAHAIIAKERELRSSSTNRSGGGSNGSGDDSISDSIGIHNSSSSSSSTNSKTRRSVVQILMDAGTAEQGKEAPLTEKEIVDNLFAFLLAGSETTSVTITWVLFFLSQPEHRYLVDAIREEGDDIFRRPPCDVHVDGAVALASVLAAMDVNAAAAMLGSSSSSSMMQGVAAACAKEALRLVGVAPLMVHDNASGERVSLGGGAVVLEPHDQIAIYLEGLQLDENVYTDATLFKPMRWLTGKEPGALSAAMEENFWAFGAGTRVCPGQSLAQLESVIAIAMLVCNFDFDLACKPEVVERELKFSARPKHVPLCLRMRK